MNILSSEQMKEKEKKLLQLYQSSEIKFKFSLQELLQAKSKKRSLFCFQKADSQTELWIQKLVPLHKKVQIINLQEEENGFFKVLAFVFLFIIYKPKQQWNFYVQEHLKCSLYSDDVDLLEVRNHSFNKKMKSDTIKAVIATFFVEIQRLIKTEAFSNTNIKVEDILAFALQKNDIIMEGFHLFYRSILAKFDVENANNCIEEVNPEEAIQSLIDYFEIDCRIFNDLYLFPESGVFMARIQQHEIVFGRYYENQLYFQETSDQQQQNLLKPSFEQQFASGSKFITKETNIERNDVKVFNFLLDTDRSADEIFQMDKSQQAATPCFIQNEEMRFGKKADRDLDTSFNKFKNRIQNEKIHQISSEEEEFEPKKEHTSITKGFPQKNTLQVNRFLNLNVDDQYSEDDDIAPTPMLGGGQHFCFGKKQQPVNHGFKNSEKVQSIQQKSEQKVKQHNNQSNQNREKKKDNLIETKQIRTSAIRRITYQGQNSSQSKSSDTNAKKLEMKTSKNQIKVIDGTASQVNLRNLDESPKKFGDESFTNQRKETVLECEKTSSYSNCTCHIQKRTKIKITSKIVQVAVSIHNETTKPLPSYQNLSSRKVSADILFEPLIKNQIKGLNFEDDNKKFLFKNSSNKSTQNLKAQNKKGPRSPVGKEQGKDHIKSQQFINFLKKDKSELIKKLTQKRIATRHVTTNGQPIQGKIHDQGGRNVKPQKRYVKQSMFVGSYNFQNPQKGTNSRDAKNRSITPNGSISKIQRNRDERSRTPTQPNEKTDGSSQGRKLVKLKEKIVAESTMTSIKSKLCGIPLPPQPIIATNPTTQQKPQISIKVPANSMNHIPAPSQYFTPTNANIKPYQFYFKK